ncbi:MAG: hypothetical protein M3146_01410 [Thermoproteota archaeon]|nr:hypothetical protein [Thermoproteota archaeon]
MQLKSSRELPFRQKYMPEANAFSLSMIGYAAAEKASFCGQNLLAIYLLQLSKDQENKNEKKRWKEKLMLHEKSIGHEMKKSRSQKKTYKIYRIYLYRRQKEMMHRKAIFMKPTARSYEPTLHAHANLFDYHIRRYKSHMCTL